MTVAISILGVFAILNMYSTVAFDILRTVQQRLNKLRTTVALFVWVACDT